MEDEYCTLPPPTFRDPPITADQQTGLEHSLPLHFQRGIRIMNNADDEENTTQEQQEQEQRPDELDRDIQREIEEQIKEVFDAEHYDAIGLAASFKERIKARIESFKRINQRLEKATTKILEVLEESTASYCKASSPWGPPAVDFIESNQSMQDVSVAIPTHKESEPSLSASTTTATNDEDASTTTSTTITISPFENMLITTESLLTEHCEKNDVFCFNTLIILNILSKLGDAYEKADQELRPRYHISGVKDIKVDPQISAPSSSSSNDYSLLTESLQKSQRTSQLLDAPEYAEQRILTNTTVIANLEDEKLKKLEWDSYELDLVKIPGIIDPYDYSSSNSMTGDEFLKEAKEHRQLLGEPPLGSNDMEESGAESVLDRLTAKINSSEYQASKKAGTLDGANPFGVTLEKEEYGFEPSSSCTTELVDNAEQ